MSKVFDATQMKSVFGDHKPNCLIIDEIDGVSGGEKNAIKQLLKVVTAQKKEGTSNGPSKKGKKRKGQKGGAKDSTDSVTSQNSMPREMKRPIICICNDQYAPALRDLRNYALGRFPLLQHTCYLPNAYHHQCSVSISPARIVWRKD